jgi:hypothetical protein
VQDIPALAALAAEQHTGVPYVVTAPIGLHELMVVRLLKLKNHKLEIWFCAISSQCIFIYVFIVTEGGGR